MKYLISAILLLYSVTADGQFRIRDRSILPVAPIATCNECVPFDIKDNEVKMALYKIAIANYKVCRIFGENQWGHEANDHNCGKGQGHVFNRYGEYATYVYIDFDPENLDKYKAGVIYWDLNDPFDTLK